MQTTRRAVRVGRLASASLVSLLFLGSPRDAHAQSDQATVRDGWVVGALVGRIGINGVRDANATAVGLEATRLAPRRPGVDLAVVSIPTLFREGQIPLHARVGVAVPLGPANGPYLVPTVGVDAAGVAGESDGAWVGYHWGAHALVAARQLGVHAGVIWVRAVGAHNALWLAEIGLMRVPLPAPPKPRPTTPVPGET